MSKNRIGKVNVCVSFASLLVYVWMFASMDPFYSDGYMNYVFVFTVGIGLFIPLVILVIIGPFIIGKRFLRMVVQCIVDIFCIVVGYIFLFEVRRLSDYEMIGVPPVMELGYYFTYVYHPSLLFFTGLIASTIFSMVGLVSNRELVLRRLPERSLMPLINALLLILLPFLFLAVFLYYGLFWVVFAIVVAKSTTAGMRIVSWLVMPGSIRNIRNAWAEVDIATPEKVQIKNGKSGFLNLFKAFTTGFVFFVLVVSNFTILDTYMKKPNWLPLWLQYFPMILVAAMIWTAVYLLTRRRRVVLLSSILILLLEWLVLLQGWPLSILTKKSMLLWLSAFSLTGILGSAILMANGMASGLFSRSTWTALTMLGFCLGLGFGPLSNVKLGSNDTLTTGIYATLSCLVIVIAGIILSRFKSFWNKNQRNIKKSLLEKSPQSDSIKINESERDDDVKRNTHLTAWEYLKRIKEIDVKQLKTVLVKVSLALVVLIAFFLPIYITVSEGRAISREQVLGTYDGDYYLWFADSIRTIDRNYKPDLENSPVNPTVHLSLARGEHEGFQVVFSPWNVKNLNVWSFKPIENLTMPGTNHVIDAGNISVFNVEYVDQLSMQYPDRLRPFERVDTGLSIHGQSNWIFYVDVYIPRNESIAPGTYQTIMEFFCFDYHEPLPGEKINYNSRIVQFTLEVEVYNFTIPLERHVSTEIIWSIPPGDEWMDFYLDHRLDWYFSPRPVKNYSVKAGNLSLIFDWDNYFNELDKAIQGGMFYFPVSYTFPGLDWTTLTYNGTAKIVFEWYLCNLTAKLANKTTPWNTTYLDQAYFFIRDEPGPELYNAIINAAKLIHEYAPSLKIMETMNQPLETYPDSFLEEVDIYCMHIHRWYPSSYYPRDDKPNGWPSRIRSFLANYNGSRKKELWVYLTHNRFPTPDTDIYMSGIMQRNSYWLFWIYGIPGWLYWSFNWGVDMSGGYGYAGYGESTLVGYRENDLPMSSLRLERIRDGIEDYEYFWLLNTTMTQLALNGNSQDAEKCRALLEEVNQMFDETRFLSHLPRSYEHEDFRPEKWSYDPRPAPYLDLRMKIGLELSRIYSAGLV
ncbi:MAG: glycoside hydrolase domain-containing protein [Promethearchaeota archaeon]